MEGSNADKVPARGCTFIVLIVIGCFAGAGIFFVIAGKLFGAEYRHIIFFSVLGLAISILLGKEIFRKK